MQEDIHDRLAARMSAIYGKSVQVNDLRRLTGGANSETWAFTCDDQRLILRREPGEIRNPHTITREARVIAAAGAQGVPVPRLIDFGDEHDTVGAPYLICEHVDGETIARKLLRDPEYEAARSGMARELGRNLARIHAIPIESVDEIDGGVRHSLERLEADYWALDEPSPTMEIALRWLADHKPADVPDSVVHGDYRNGNLIIDTTGLQAVLDWELVHRGDPREDLGWVLVKCWRFGTEPEVGGFGSVEELLDGYAEISGARPDLDAVRWWQVLGTARWGLGCRGMAERHLRGTDRSVEMAAIGRRVCEQEHDVLTLLGYPAGTPTTTATALPWTELHGRPTSPELIIAVVEYLREQVLPQTEGRLSFLARVAANVMDQVGRELAFGAAQQQHLHTALEALGFTDLQSLALSVRSGATSAADPAVVAVIRSSVTDRLAVANPKYLAAPG
ncbi:MAG: phosphotransferase family protein [Antricoccus sp.]